MDYANVSYADFNLLKFPDKAQAMEIVRTDSAVRYFPTGYHCGAVTAGCNYRVYRLRRRRGPRSASHARRRAVCSSSSSAT